MLDFTVMQMSRVNRERLGLGGLAGLAAESVEGGKDD